MHQIIFIMGVSGSGKSTIGRLLGQELNYTFFDADDFHPPDNIQKMKQGIALDDQDRQGWLEKIKTKIGYTIEVQSLIFACSALKEKYRAFLSQGWERQTQWIYLEGGFEIIKHRMQAREDHFMPTDLLKSQFNDLEPPQDALSLDIGQPPPLLVKKIIKELKL